MPYIIFRPLLHVQRGDRPSVVRNFTILNIITVLIIYYFNN